MRSEADDVFGVSARAEAKSCGEAVERRQLPIDVRISWRKLSMSVEVVSLQANLPVPFS